MVVPSSSFFTSLTKATISLMPVFKVAILNLEKVLYNNAQLKTQLLVFTRLRGRKLLRFRDAISYFISGFISVYTQRAWIDMAVVKQWVEDEICMASFLQRLSTVRVIERCETCVSTYKYIFWTQICIIAPESIHSAVQAIGATF